MKPLTLVLPLLAFVAIAGITSAILGTDQPDPVRYDAADPAAAEAAPGSPDSLGASDLPPELLQELRALRADVAALRRLIESGAASGGRAPVLEAGSAAAAAGAGVRSGASSGDWASLMRETEQRLLIESISRHRTQTRLALSQEEASAADTGAMAEVRAEAAGAVERLRGALVALEDVRDAGDLARWCEQFSIAQRD